MTTDYYFRMGSSHTICQDYCIAGSETFQHGDSSDTVEYAVLSDGCSGEPDPAKPGSPYTDFGARILVRAAQRQIRDIPYLGYPQERIISDAEAGVRALGLPSYALDATLLMATYSGDFARVFWHGDGVVVSRDRTTGNFDYHVRTFGQNMPYYLRYTTNLDREMFYQDQAKVMTTTYGWLKDGVWNRNTETKNLSSLSKAELGWNRVYGKASTDLVILFSDGVESFIDRNGDLVPLETVLTELLKFKGLTGEFIQRRCNRFLQKFCQETGWKHSDDFSMTGIHLE